MSITSSRATSLRILSISILGKQGNPLLLRSYSSKSGGQADLKWEYATHTSLDYFEERELPTAKTVDPYLGLLYAMEDYAVYGYQTNTRIKFVLILALADAVVRDLDVKTIFRAIHNSYINYLSNPFNKELETQILSNQLQAPIRFIWIVLGCRAASVLSFIEREQDSSSTSLLKKRDYIIQRTESLLPPSSRSKKV